MTPVKSRSRKGTDWVDRLAGFLRLEPRPSFPLRRRYSLQLTRMFIISWPLHVLHPCMTVPAEPLSGFCVSQSEPHAHVQKASLAKTASRARHHPAPAIHSQQDDPSDTQI